MIFYQCFVVRKAIEILNFGVIKLMLLLYYSCFIIGRVNLIDSNLEKRKNVWLDTHTMHKVIELRLPRCHCNCL